MRYAPIFLALALAGCALPGQQQAAGPVEVGANLVGEKCAMQPSARANAEGIGDDLHTIRCGDWEFPSARIFRRAGGGAPEQAAENVAWHGFLEQRMTCDAPKTTTLGSGAPAAMMACKLRNGGWPFVALAVVADGKTYLADGIPAALPAIELGIAKLAGGNAAAAPERSAALDRLREEMRGRFFGSGDLKDYYRLVQLGQYSDAVKDHGEAEKAYRDALAIQERLLGPDHAENADPMMNLALQLSNQRRFAEADALFDRAAQLTATGNPALAARLVSYRAINAANKGARARAIEQARQATAMRQGLLAFSGSSGGAPSGTNELRRGEVGGGQNQVIADPALNAALADIVQSQYIEASLLLRQGEPVRAASKADDALASLQKVRTRPEWWLPQLYELDADIALARGDTARSEASLRQAAEVWPKLFKESRPEALTHLQLGKVLAASGRKDEALEEFRRGRAILARAGGGARFEHIAPYIDTLIEAAKAAPDKRDALAAEAFEAAQLIRGGITQRSISLAAARLSAGDTEVGKLIREKQDNELLRNQLLSEYNELVAAPPALQSKSRLSALRDRIAELDTAAETLENGVQAAASGYKQLLEVPATAARTIELVRPDEALLLYVLGEPHGFVFVVADGRIAAVPLALGENEAVQRIAQLRKGVTVGDDGQLRPFDLDAAYKLHELILGPVESAIAGKRRLVVATSGPLLGLPFGLLVTAPAQPGDYAHAQWLLRKATISAVPSVRSLVDLRAVATPSHADRPLIGFGGFRPPSAAALVKGLPGACTEDRKRLASLGPLPGTVSELHQVAAIAGAGEKDLILGDAFTREAVLKAPLSHYRVVYLATHALLPTELDCRPEPTLLVSAPGAASPFLDTRDIEQLSLDADLVVLSACNTAGPGGQSAGESLSGLARAFFYAGARALLVTHWAVEDTATARLMTSAFRTMTERLSGTGEALRAAQLAMIDGPGPYAHPIFWAAFSLVGDGERALGAAG
jgi:CHAT domain-containing protein